MTWIKDQFKKRAVAIRSIFSKSFLHLPLKTKLKMLLEARKEKLVLVKNQVFVSTFIPPLLSKPYDRYLKWAEKFFAGKYSPKYLNICLTNNCPYNCEHCSNKNAEKGNELTVAEIKKVFDFFKNKGIFKVIITGGEPLLRPDLEDIISALDKESVFVSLCTSGFGLSLERAKALKKAGLTIIKIGLDFPDQKQNDYYKKFNGAFNNSLEAIKNALSTGLCVVVHTVLKRELIGSPREFFKFVDFLENLGVHELEFLEPKPCGNYLSFDKMLRSVEKEKFYILSKKVNHSSRKIKCSSYFEYEDKMGCMAGLSNFYLDAIGNLCPCVFAPEPIGNIRKDSLEEIYGRFGKKFQFLGKKMFSF